MLFQKKKQKLEKSAKLELRQRNRRGSLAKLHRGTLPQQSADEAKTRSQ